MRVAVVTITIDPDGTETAIWQMIRSTTCLTGLFDSPNGPGTGRTKSRKRPAGKKNNASSRGHQKNGNR